MAQNARNTIFLALALGLAALPARACDCPSRAERAPVVLNGHLNTSDFSGGVGYGAYDSGYVQSSVYVSGGTYASGYAAAGAFASARASAFAHASSGGHTSFCGPASSCG